MRELVAFGLGEELSEVRVDVPLCQPEREERPEEPAAASEFAYRRDLDAGASTGRRGCANPPCASGPEEVGVDDYPSERVGLRPSYRRRSQTSPIGQGVFDPAAARLRKHAATLAQPTLFAPRAARGSPRGLLKKGSRPRERSSGDVVAYSRFRSVLSLSASAFGEERLPRRVAMSQIRLCCCCVVAV